MGSGNIYRNDLYGRGDWTGIGAPSIDGIHPGVNAVIVDGLDLLAATDRGVFRGTYEPDSSTLTWVPEGLNEEVWPDAVVLQLGGGPDDHDLWAGTTRGLYRFRGGAVDLAIPPRLGNRDDVISDVLVDPACPSRIYAARGFQPGDARRHGGGVMVSEDAGDHWISLTEGDAIDNVPVTDLDMEPAHPERLYVATFGLGVWQLDWAKLPACGGGPQ